MTRESDAVPLPFCAAGKVVHGFQRGSRELGFPTANMAFATEEGKALKQKLTQGVYYGFVQVHGEVYPMATSVGDNPHYGNEDVTVEVHVLHVFEEDFYGAMISCLFTGYVRPMTPFSSLDELITAIKRDCEVARKETSGKDSHLATHPFLLKPSAESAGDMPCIM